jgi:hypothetical protein
METIRVVADVARDGSIHIDAQTTLQPGPAEVVVVVNPLLGDNEIIDWSDAYGVDKALWQGVDAQEYVNRLRDEWER